MNKSFVIILTIMFCFSIITMQPTVTYAGWKDKISSFKNNAKENIKKKYNTTKDRYKKKYNSSKNKYKQKINASKERVKQKYSSGKKAVRDRYNSTKDKYKEKYSYSKDRYKKKYNTIKTKIQSKTKDFSHKYIEKGAIAKKNFVQAIVNKKDAIGYRISVKSKRLSDATKAKIRSFGNRYGPKAEEGLVNFYNAAKGKKMVAEQQLGKTISSIQKRIKNPEIRKMAISGVVVASAVTYYGYTHKDDIQYMVINSTMEKVNVPVNGKMMSVESLISQSVCKNAPFLKNSTLANDPSAVLAYGVTATTKDDLMEKLEIVPDGNGNVVSVNAALSQATGSDDALSALQISNSLEGMARTAAEEGHLGVYGQQFAGTYAYMEENVHGKE